MKWKTGNSEEGERGSSWVGGWDSYFRYLLTKRFRAVGGRCGQGGGSHQKGRDIPGDKIILKECYLKPFSMDRGDRTPERKDTENVGGGGGGMGCPSRKCIEPGSGGRQTHAILTHLCPGPIKRLAGEERI